MISLKAALGYVLLLATSVKVSAFDANTCDVFVFRTTENALWHCGPALPAEPWNQWTSLYCDHANGDNSWPFAWASNHPDDWCAFMVNTVRQSNEDHYALTPDIGINETPGPNIYSFQSIVDWGCYKVENGVTTESYLVDSRAGEHASTVHTQCPRSMNYFDYWMLFPEVRNADWHPNASNDIWYPGWTGFVPETDYTPARNKWERCHYDDALTAPNYVPELGVEYAECALGFVCELKYTDMAKCFPDPHADHECCISWNNKCENKGECCAGSECDDNGFCSQMVEQEFEDPPGICSHSREVKTVKNLWSRCFDYGSGGQGDCADGYNCIGTWEYAQCEVDESVKSDCCLYKHEVNARPGDCCLGWRFHCNTFDDETGKCISSICVPGIEMGVNEWGESMIGVHDRICSEPPLEASYYEQVGECRGAVCGIWGDPHIVTCDELKFDCQAVGLFTLMSNHMFNIQAYFIHLTNPWGSASVTNDIAIDFVKNEPNNVPTMQFSFPRFSDYNEGTTDFDPFQRKIGACPVLFYLDGQPIDISGVPQDGYLYGDANSDYSVKLLGWNQIDIKHKAGEDENGNPYYSESVIWVDGSGPYTAWACILTYFICLPGQDKTDFEDHSTGLLGSPNGDSQDDWMAPDGHILLIPDNGREEASFNYCVDNWCVEEDGSIFTYPGNTTYDDYACPSQIHEPFDPWACPNPQEIIDACVDSPEPITCQIELCIGNPHTDDQIDNVNNITTNNGTIPGGDNLVEFPDVGSEEEYGDCTDLGSGLSSSTGQGAYSLVYPSIGCIWNDGHGFSIGYDNSVSVLVGGSFTCKKGAGFEGRGVFIGDMTIEESGCERMAATGHGSLIHPFDNTACIEVGGSVSIDASFVNSKYIMYEYGNSAKTCHLVYGGGCSVNGGECPTTSSDLQVQGIFTEGDITQIPNVNLTRWSDEITLLQQKTEYWKTLEPNGVVDIQNNLIILRPGPDNKIVQIFEIDTIGDNIVGLVYDKHMDAKTIMIKVKGSGDFNVPPNCYHPPDAMTTDAPICGRDSFPPQLTTSIVWLFESSSNVNIKGVTTELQGSVVKPYGDMTISVSGQNGRLIVGGNLIMDGEFTELHNYEFDPQAGPLPLGTELDEVCTVAPPPVCDESYKVLTNETVCPSAPEGIVKLLKASARLPDGEPVLYDILLEPPANGNSGYSVKFKVDNPFTNHTDIFIKHVKKVGEFAMDPTCESMPFTAGCEHEAPIIEVGCHEYEGVNPFALVNIYFASNTDGMVMDVGSGGDVTIDKCCQPPGDYEAGYGVVEYTFEIQCACPDGTAQS